MVLAQPGSMHATQRLLTHGRILSGRQDTGDVVDILINGDTIVQVAEPGQLSREGREIVDASDSLVLPGLVNGHTHSHGALARGLVPDKVSLEGFLSGLSALNGQRTLDDLRLSAELSAVELVRRGCTSCFDMALQLPQPSTDGLTAIGQAYASVGLRAVIAPMVADRTLYQANPAMLAALPQGLQDSVVGVQLPTASALISACRDAQAAWPFDRQLVQLGIGPAIPMHCSDELLQACGQLSQEFKVPLQTHLLESRVQALFGHHQGESPTRRLQRLGCLSERTTVAHGVWLDDDDMAVLQASGAMVVHNPLSNLRLGSGIAPVRRLVQSQVGVAVGTDSSNTSDGQNLFEAIRMTAFLSRMATPDWNDWIGADEAWHLAAQGGARAMGLADRLGHVAPGYLADLTLIDLKGPHYVPLRHVLRQTVFSENGAGVQHVIVNGRSVFTNGQVLGIDEAALRQRAQAAAARLDAALAPARSLAGRLNPWLAAFCCDTPGQPTMAPRRVLY
jgi:guanine deaminase